MLGLSLIPATLLAPLVPAWAQEQSCTPGTFVGGLYTFADEGGLIEGVDLDKDGLVDLVTTGDDALQVFMGLGAGDFAPPVQYNVGSFPEVRAIADVNADTWPDVILGDQFLETVTVMYGDGTGALLFPNVIPLPANSNPRDIEVVDVTQDGIPDLVAALHGRHVVGIMAGGGGGGFLTMVQVPANTAPTAVAVGDLNGDTHMDLVTVRDNANVVSVMLADGVGGFAAPVAHDDGKNGRDVVLIDLDKDGNLDVVASLVSSDMAVLLGDGAGGLGPYTHYDGATGKIRLVDFDVDGELDLLVASPGIRMLRSDLAGGLVDMGTLTSSSPVVGFFAGDVDGDPNLDLVFTHTEVRTMRIALAEAPLTFGPHPFLTNTNAGEFAMADLNEDGWLDLARTNRQDNTLSVFLADGQGGYVQGPAMPVTGARPVGVDIADLDGDGHLDIACTNENTGLVDRFIGDGLGGFTRIGFLAVNGQPERLVLRDLNGDGEPDVITLSLLTDEMSVLLSDGQGGYLPESVYPTGDNPKQLALGDFDGDQALDVAIVTSLDSTWDYRLGDGQGGFGVRTTVVYGAFSQSVASVDWNQDGYDDVMIGSTFAAARLHLSDGLGGFSAGIDLFPTASASYLAAADLDLDGLPDVVYTDPTDGSLVFRRGDGQGGFGPEEFYTVGSHPEDVIVADVDRDQFPDLVVAGTGKFTIVHANRWEPFVYCSARVNSCGTLPSIGSTGDASAAAASGFVVSAANTKALKSGLLVYTDAGHAALPFQGGTLCLQTPIKRSVVVTDTTGTPTACNGVLSIDMNAFAAGLLGGNPAPFLLVPGTQVNAQFWGRDTFAHGSLLSDALRYVVCP